MSMEWPAKRVRRQFIDYYVNKEHEFVRSSPTVPHDDPTLLFANSGMAQFKPVFLGTVDPASHMGRLRRVANTQKCIRAGGKHNDLDDVGKDEYHHTFFEMLGNWSFGDYFKAEAIDMAWELLTAVYKLPADRLYITYFRGEPSLGLPADTEARDLWIAKGMDPRRVLPFGMKENFWEMGETGPCGPCSEIHYDRLGGRDGAALVNADDPTLLEIWNLVFMQFSREADGSLRPLPSKHVDTGMGFERLVSVLQDKRSNYDTDVFAPIFAAIAAGARVRPYTGLVGRADVDGVDTAYRVVADHIRTLVVAMSDGGEPSNDGRGYVLRRILRRAIRYAHDKLKAPVGFFASLVPVIVDQMADEFPELAANPAHIQQTLLEEERQFRRTLERGLAQFEKYAAKASGRLEGHDVWRLYDTYGFPVDLTKLMAEERGLSIDEAGYVAAQDEARLVSRGLGQLSLDDNAFVGYKLSVHQMKVLAAVARTDDAAKYDETDSPVAGRVVALFGAFDEELLEAVSDSAVPYAVILDKTNFYAEAGGQLFDQGLLEGAHGVFQVQSVQAFGAFVVHLGFVKGRLAVGEELGCFPEPARRHALRLNHTATHLLNFALHRLLPTEHVEQKGSLVAPDRLRFDFSCKRGLAADEVAAIEAHVNQLVAAALRLDVREVPLALAKRIAGLRAVFGETYPDPVRVVSCGVALAQVLADPESSRWHDYSIELCGGTHVMDTDSLRRFVIVSEATIAKGTRRIVALTGQEALAAQARAAAFEDTLAGLAGLDDAVLDSRLKTAGKDLDLLEISLLDKTRFRTVLGQHRKVWDDRDKQCKANQVKLAADFVQSSPDPVVIGALAVGSNAKALSNGVNLAVKAGKPCLLMSFDASEQKVYVYAALPSDLCDAKSALAWLDCLSPLLAVKCGGKSAQAQGSAACTAFDEKALIALAQSYF